MNEGLIQDFLDKYVSYEDGTAARAALREIWEAAYNDGCDDTEEKF